MNSLEKTRLFLSIESKVYSVLQKDTKLYHFGAYSKDQSKLDRPMWVSDDFSKAYEYKDFSRFNNRKVFYSQFLLTESIRLVDINELNLLNLSKALDNEPIRPNVDKYIISILLENDMQALMTYGREILIDFSYLKPISSIIVDDTSSKEVLNF